MDRWLVFEGTAQRDRVTDREVFVVGKGYTKMAEVQVGDRLSNHNPANPSSSRKVVKIVDETVTTDSPPMTTLDELVAKYAEYRAKVATCEHDFSRLGPFSGEFGKECVHCDVSELPWLRSEVARQRPLVDAAVTFVQDSVGGYMGRVWADTSDGRALVSAVEVYRRAER